MRKISIILIAILVFSCKAKLNYKIVDVDSARIKLMESNIIDRSLFRNVKQSFSLTEMEIDEIQVNLEKSFVRFNKENYYNEKLEVKDYKMFLVPYINSKDEKLIKVFAYCDADHDEWWDFVDFFNVNDGGSCYFRTIINLSSKQEATISPNGRA